jgi:hypothetical protein
MNGCGYAIWCHPDNLHYLESMKRDLDFGGIPVPSVMDFIPIKTSEYLPRFIRRWVPPRGRFWEMEESDRAWAEKLGLGHMEDTAEPWFARIEDRRAWPTPWRISPVLTCMS